jgi:hypothetical protein
MSGPVGNLCCMAQPPRAFRIGSIFWSLLLGGVVIFIGGAILLPSTKSSRVQTERIRQMANERERDRLAAIAAAAEAEAAGGSTTAPATAPTNEASTAPTAALGEPSAPAAPAGE